MLSEDEKIRFEAIIEQHSGMDAAFVVFPYDVFELFGVKGQVKVKVLFDGQVSYRGSLAKKAADGHLLGLTKAVRQQLSKTFGDAVHVELEQDLEERKVEIPDEVNDLLNCHPEARKFFEGLSYTDRKEYMVWMTSAKKKETRQARLGAFIPKLLAGKKVNDK
jgi:hypothetical protein